MINAAIVGIGGWGRNLVDNVQDSSDVIRFVAGTTRSPERARDYAQGLGFPLYDSYSQVLTDPDVDAVVLATPHTLHADQIIAAAAAGKHVFSEKPLALTAKDADAAVGACTEAGVTLAVGFNWRFQPALQAIRRMVADGRLGKLLHVEGNFCGPSVYRFGRDHWRQAREEGPAGGMTGRGVHLVDAFLHLAGHVDSVYAQSSRNVLDHGLDDATSMLFRFRGGATGYLSTVIATAETWRVQVFGSRGWAEVGGVEHLTTWDLKVCFVEDPHAQPQVIRFPPVSTERAELEDFARAATERRPIAVAGGDEAHGVAVLEAVLRSATSGKSTLV